jgi:hypothetical protein
MVPLFEDGAQPATWNERMVPGEYAVHYSSFDDAAGIPPYCTVCRSLAEAEVYAEEEVARRPALRCRIYDHQGFVGQPLRELRGSRYKGEGEISSRFRRWAGGGMLLGGVVLTLLDWSTDFRLSWAAMIGIRLLLPGVVLVLTEAVLVLHGRRARQRAQ